MSISDKQLKRIDGCHLKYFLLDSSPKLIMLSLVSRDIIYRNKIITKHCWYEMSSIKLCVYFFINDLQINIKLLLMKSVGYRNFQGGKHWRNQETMSHKTGITFYVRIFYTISILSKCIRLLEKIDYSSYHWYRCCILNWKN